MISSLSIAVAAQYGLLLWGNICGVLGAPPSIAGEDAEERVASKGKDATEKWVPTKKGNPSTSLGVFAAAADDDVLSRRLSPGVTTATTTFAIFRMESLPEYQELWLSRSDFGCLWALVQ